MPKIIDLFVIEFNQGHSSIHTWLQTKEYKNRKQTIKAVQMKLIMIKVNWLGMLAILLSCCWLICIANVELFWFFFCRLCRMQSDTTRLLNHALWIQSIRWLVLITIFLRVEAKAAVMVCPSTRHIVTLHYKMFYNRFVMSSWSGLIDAHPN